MENIVKIDWVVNCTLAEHADSREKKIRPLSIKIKKFLVLIFCLKAITEVGLSSKRLTKNGVLADKLECLENTE